MLILMCRPKYFDVPVAYQEKNPWMDVRRPPNPKRAMTQWKELRNFYRSFLRVKEIQPRRGLFDQVFTANIAWGMGNAFIMANLAPPERRAEIKYAAHWFVDNRYSVHFLPPNLGFEGQGDIVNVGKCLFFCYGGRNTLDSKEYIEKVFRLKKQLVPLRLVDPRFYHGDMCIRYSRSRNTILYIPAAFDKDSLRIIEQLKIKKMEAPPELWVQETEYGRNFPMNGCYLDSVETFPWDEGLGEFPRAIRRWVEDGGGTLWLHNFDQFGLSGAGHRCVTLFLN